MTFCLVRLAAALAVALFFAWLLSLLWRWTRGLPFP